MPTKVFENLKEEKKRIIIAAIEKEVSMYPFEKVQVKRIIETASIARGSFYQYFENLEDMYLFILKRQQGQVAHLQQSQIEQDENAFSTIKEMFFNRLRKSYSTTNEEFGFGVIENVRKSKKGIDLFLESMGYKESSKMIQLLLSSYDSITDFDRDMIQEILIPTLKVTIEKLFKDTISLDKAIKELDYKFKVIQEYIEK